MFDSILVVCVGNICRSPIGAALLQQALPGKTISSAGVGALVGHPADPLSIELLAERGLDLSAHSARQLTPSLIRSADLILVMEMGHKKAVDAIDPSGRGKVYRWGEWGDFDIPDPYQRPREAFEEALVLLDRGLADWLPKLKG